MRKYGLDYYEKQSDVVDTEIMKNNRITFSILAAILKNQPDRVYTDHKRIIICQSCRPFPVWVWTVETITADEKQQIAECLHVEFPVEEGYTYNMSHQLADQLQRNPVFDHKLKIQFILFSFRCDRVLMSNDHCEGAMRKACNKDIDVLTQYKYEFETEALGSEPDREQCKRSVQQKIENGTFFVWENQEHEITSMASIVLDDGMAKFSNVYAVPRFRRKGYTFNLMRSVTQIILEKGLVPVLYTNADYPASNGCYKKVGYQQVGSLCTIGA
ncbi:acetyltransferase GNAT family protein [Lachnospiraceae bacterium KM106-2]|nr:acetyltransferase GNAT family protein [Lachnospiraceae bacterium KM106-2]